MFCSPEVQNMPQRKGSGNRRYSDMFWQTSITLIIFYLFFPLQAPFFFIISFFPHPFPKPCMTHGLFHGIQGDDPGFRPAESAFPRWCAHTCRGLRRGFGKAFDPQWCEVLNGRMVPWQPAFWVLGPASSSIDLSRFIMMIHLSK